MAMIRGQVHLEREVVSRKISVGGAGPSPYKLENGKWVNKERPSEKVAKITLSEILDNLQKAQEATDNQPDLE